MARRFLEEGSRVRLSVRYRGREAAHPEVGEKLLQRFVELCGPLVHGIGGGLFREPRGAYVVVIPKKSGQA